MLWRRGYGRPSTGHNNEKRRGGDFIQVHEGAHPLASVSDFATRYSKKSTKRLALSLPGALAGESRQVLSTENGDSLGCGMREAVVWTRRREAGKAMAEKRRRAHADPRGS